MVRKKGYSNVFNGSEGEPGFRERITRSTLILHFYWLSTLTFVAYKSLRDLFHPELFN